MKKIMKFLSIFSAALCISSLTSCFGEDEEDNKPGPDASIPESNQNLPAGTITNLDPNNIKGFVDITAKDEVVYNDTLNIYTRIGANVTFTGHPNLFLYVSVTVTCEQRYSVMNAAGEYNQEKVSGTIILDKYGNGTFTSQKDILFESYKDSEFVITAVTGYASKK